MVFGFAFVGVAANMGVVEKAASRGALERPYEAGETEGLRRHFQQFVEAIASAWIGKLWCVGTDALMLEVLAWYTFEKGR